MYFSIFSRKVLRKTSGIEETGEMLWDLALCSLLSWFIIFLVLSKGVETLGKVLVSFLEIWLQIKTFLSIQFLYSNVCLSHWVKNVFWWACSYIVMFLERQLSSKCTVVIPLKGPHLVAHRPYRICIFQGELFLFLMPPVCVVYLKNASYVILYNPL